MLGGLASDSAVGIYQAAASMSNQMRFGLSAVSAAFSPLVADLYQSGKLEALRRIYADTVRWVALITLPVAVILFVFAPVIMSIYGSAFSEGGDLLRILTMANLVVVGVGSVGYVLQMSDHQDFVLVVNLFMATLNIGLNWLLIRSYGASGAAAATGFTQALGNTVQVIALYRFTGVQPFRWALWKPVVAAGVAGLGAWSVQALLPNPAAWLVGIPTAGLLYLGTALGLGLHPKDQSVVEALWTRVRRGASS
jgi:O-antigen/teichoic acid export membrane protein